MARRVAGITVETRRIELRAVGRMYDPVCVQSPSDCCGERPTACCPGDPDEVLFGTADGPVGPGGATAIFDLTLARPDPAAQVWESDVAYGSGSGLSQLEVTLGCDPSTGWWLEGSLFPNGLPSRSFRIGLADDGMGYLVGLLFLPERELPVDFVIEHPCPAAAGSGASGSAQQQITTPCNPSNPLPTTLYVHITGGTPAGVYPITWNSGASRWEAPARNLGGSCDAAVFQFSCVSGNWNLSVSDLGGSCCGSAISTTYTPSFVATFAVTPVWNACGTAPSSIQVKSTP